MSQVLYICRFLCFGIESGECGVAWSVERNVLGSDAKGVEQNERWERDGQDHDRVGRSHTLTVNCDETRRPSETKRARVDPSDVYDMYRPDLVHAGEDYVRRTVPEQY